MYGDAVRLSWGCFQKTSALHLITRIPWTERTWAPPFLTALAPSGSYPTYVEKGRRHKPLSERARGLNRRPEFEHNRGLAIAMDCPLLPIRMARKLRPVCAKTRTPKRKRNASKGAENRGTDQKLAARHIQSHSRQAHRIRDRQST